MIQVVNVTVSATSKSLDFSCFFLNFLHTGTSGQFASQKFAVRSVILQSSFKSFQASRKKEKINVTGSGPLSLSCQTALKAAMVQM